MTSSIRRWLSAALASAVLVGAITVVIALLEPRVPALGLGVLYLLAVVPIALVYGSAVAGVVSVASMVAFSYFFLPPRYSLSPGTSDRWSVLVAFLVASLVVGQLAARSQRQARRSARFADQQARLAEEQAALRRVGTLVARGVSAEEVFAGVAEEVGRLLPVEYAGLSRYGPDGALIAVAGSGRALDHIPVGSRWTLGGRNVATVVFETGRPARIDSYADLSDPGAVTALREVGVRSAVGTPVVVDGHLWGVMIAGTTAEQLLPADTEARLASFTELLATAIANAESRAGLARLAEEQAALRRVATLVAHGTRPEEVFAAVTEEIGRLLAVDLTTMGRYEHDGTFAIVATWGGRGEDVPVVGSRWPLGVRTSARSCSRLGDRPGSTTSLMPPARSLRASARTASARRSGRRSTSRAACGA
ncbi:MAG: histidine kinase [Conexibacter sp.]|nr:histidine kinase [Conexibacter sp.]